MLSQSSMLHHLHPPPPPPSPPPHLRTLHSVKISHRSLHFSPPSSSFSHRSIIKHISKFPRSCFCYCSDSSTSLPSTNDEFNMELGRLLALLPEEMRRRATEHPELDNLIEVVMDLGRKPLARFPSGDFILSDHPITFQDLEHATSQVGDFAVDNRAGISRTLHRISAIRNRKGAIVGLTCRVGRAISGSADLLRDLVKDEASILLIGPPGVGKTTIIREIARMLADDYRKRVMIVDTSNEIGGDGDIPHAGIGKARRMQVPHTDMQHKVLIEAVENHMPQVIVIDEIGTKLEAMAASTIAQRGIQLVATAHGVTIENLIMNPSLEMLVGGVQSVTLGDEEASRRGGQKTVLERKGPSTFTCAVEIISKAELRVHRSLEATVDAVLSGRAPRFEVRKINTWGLGNMLTIEEEPSIDISFQNHDEILVEDFLEMNDKLVNENEFNSKVATNMVESTYRDEVAIHLYVYGIPETSVIQGIKQLKADDTVELTDNISEADALLALQSKLKKNPRIQAVAKSHHKSIYVTKTSSLVQIMKAIRALISEHTDGSKDFEGEDKMSSSEKMDALEEARLVIEQVVIPKGEPVELLPRSFHITSLQMDLAKECQLQSERVGKEPNARLRILPLHIRMDEGRSTDEIIDTRDNFDENGIDDDMNNGSVYSVDRLPFLPD
ncbi:AAA+ ATPase domain [Macleaya cordata]|uniref:AAA+ ATPase domain n=1 Tax=Macleaya cordata TaxID=56857 RepID=A0A200PYS8_MACCD|nr:AAA+ ATPase domain [Macleaya cordata]